MNLNLKRDLVSNSSNRSGQAPSKKQCQKLSTAAEMGDSDVSLSDDDNDDDLLKLSRSMQAHSNKSDGKVSVPAPSTVFLKLAENRIRENELANATLAATGTIPGRHPRPALATLHLPSGARHDIERMQYQQASTIFNTTTPGNTTKATISTNSISNASRRDFTKNRGSYKSEAENLHLVGSILLSSARLIQNSALSQNSSNSLIKGQHMGKQMINLRTGNAVLDQLHFGESQKKIGSAVKNLSNEKENIRRDQIAQKQSAELLEIQQLLGKKSTHTEEREVEWFDGFEERTSKLAAKEENLKKMALVVNSFTRAYHCRECKVITESELAVQLCSQKEHTIVRVKAVKWFFECAVCKKRDSTLSLAPTGGAAAHHTGRSTGTGDPNNNRTKFNPSALPDTEIVSGMSSKQHPTRRCECGGFNWRSCSKYGSNEGTSIKSDQRIILSASEWTSRKDLASLDSIRSSIL